LRELEGWSVRASQPLERIAIAVAIFNRYDKIVGARFPRPELGKVSGGRKQTAIAVSRRQ
jgi:hypothetical protein